MPLDVGMLRKWRDDLAEEMAQLKAQIEPLDAQLRHKQEELAAVESLLALQHADPDAQAATLPSPQLTSPARNVRHLRCCL